MLNRYPYSINTTQSLQEDSIFAIICIRAERYNRDMCYYEIPHWDHQPQYLLNHMYGHPIYHRNRSLSYQNSYTHQPNSSPLQRGEDRRNTM